MNNFASKQTLTQRPAELTLSGYERIANTWSSVSPYTNSHCQLSYFVDIKQDMICNGSIAYKLTRASCVSVIKPLRPGE